MGKMLKEPKIPVPEYIKALYADITVEKMRRTLAEDDAKEIEKPVEECVRFYEEYSDDYIYILYHGWTLVDKEALKNFEGIIAQKELL